MLHTFHPETARRQSEGLRHDQPAVLSARCHVSVQALRLVTLTGLPLYWAWPSALCAAVSRWPLGKRCVPNLRMNGRRTSSNTWMPELATMSTCEHGSRSVFPNGASRGSQGQPVNMSWVCMTITIIQHTAMSPDLLGEVDFLSTKQFYFCKCKTTYIVACYDIEEKKKQPWALWTIA